MNDSAWLPELAAHLASGALALFVGGDAPAAVAGLPSRQELADRLALRVGLTPGPTLAEITQRLARRGQRWEFTDFLIHALDAAASPQGWHTRLAQLPVTTIITTAYDDRLARALRSSGRPFDHLVQASQVAFRTPRAVSLIQLYGWVGQPDTLVVTETDMLQFWENPAKKALLDRVRTILEEYHLLVVGQDLADPIFKQLWANNLARLGSLTPAAYAVAPDASADQQAVWADRNLHILPADPLAVLAQLAAS